VNYRLPTVPTDIPAPLPGRNEEATQKAVLVTVPEQVFAHWIEIKLMASTMEAPPQQCTWCGLILTGRWQGATFLHSTEEGLSPYLFPDYSHGLCDVCKDIIYLQWCQSRAAKVTEQQRNRDERLNENISTEPLFTAREEQGGEASCPEIACA
jgi:hypothetical protein